MKNRWQTSGGGGEKESSCRQREGGRENITYNEKCTEEIKMRDLQEEKGKSDPNTVEIIYKKEKEIRDKNTEE